MYLYHLNVFGRDKEHFHMKRKLLQIYLQIQSPFASWRWPSWHLRHVGSSFIHVLQFSIVIGKTHAAEERIDNYFKITFLSK